MRNEGIARIALRAFGFVSLVLTSAVACAQAVDPPSSSSFPIDLATTLRLAGAQNLDVQLARTAVDEARANYASAIERFLPTLAAGVRRSFALRAAPRQLASTATSAANRRRLSDRRSARA